MINRLITYLYTGDYEPCKLTSLLKFHKLKISESAIFSNILHQYEPSEQCACFVRNSYSTGNPSNDLLRTQSATPLSIHADMYALGDKYQVEGLCTLATSKFSASLSRHWNSTDFITAVQTVYSSTPDSNRGMRDVVAQAFQNHFGTDITKNPLIEAKLHTIDELSFELLKSWPQKPQSLGIKSKPAGIRVASTGALTASPFRLGGSNLQAGIGKTNVVSNPRASVNLFGGAG